MAIIKCKMCGGELKLQEDSSTAECEYCGSVQTVPKADDEKKLTLFARANRLRIACDFDKAAGVYESIVADHPEEAEAYWGLVLCKFGIEYVDDPATGRRLPTCHRSSFDSILDDSDLEQALENADVAAQRLYRREAKEFERIRKGILEVSSGEKPYDIFICYKETDEKGDRTLDSVLAQDLYSALTDKGYRVFFSRITLRGKLGEAYEPYIFAALNSAKVMLAVGTCYEHYNAVWVKNEWSRFLKLAAKDKDKHLIPCYRDLDPEDMPREFNHLQGADLSKMGAVQDILFNMEKYIPLQKETTTVIQERVVVGGSGDNKIASLLDRGNMALEDGDWAKADSFFEDVLNNDSKNAQAYLGKTLAQERCRTIDAFARKRKEAIQNGRSETLRLPPAEAHIRQILERYTIPGYVSGDKLRKLYDFDLRYPSQVADRKAQYEAEAAYWENHRQLSRAEKFAAGEFAQLLQREKQALLGAFTDRVKAAQAAETAAKTALQQRYEQHLQQADVQTEQLFRTGLATREEEYRKLQAAVAAAESVESLTHAANAYARLGDYLDSRQLLAACREQAAQMQERLDAAAEEARQRARQNLEAKQAAEQKKLIRRIVAITAVLALALTVGIVWSKVIRPARDYNAAQQLFDAGKYSEAAAQFKQMGDYKDSRDKVTACQVAILDEAYAEAVALLEAKDYEAARAAFLEIPEHRDSLEKAEQCEKAALDEEYAAAMALLEAGKYEEAYGAFGLISGHRDSKEQMTACRLLQAKQYEEAEDHENAIKYYEAGGNPEKANELRYSYVQGHKNNKDTTTYGYLKTLCEAGYRDADAIYASLYKLKARIFFNESREDTKTSKKKINSRDSGGYNDAYCHYIVEGGPPEEKVEVRIVYETRWGTNNKPREPYKEESDAVTTVTPGEYQLYWRFGLASNLYYHRVTIYDAKTGEQLAQAVLQSFWYD